MVTAERLWGLVATPRADEGWARQDAREALAAALDGVEAGLATSLEPRMASLRQALAGRLRWTCWTCGQTVDVRKKKKQKKKESEEEEEEDE